ncbi:MAG: hypothetical protein J6K87_00895 [Clostridia bacterium]|nr:hypothetical protein [Clostridia bacterium]
MIVPQNYSQSIIKSGNEVKIRSKINLTLFSGTYYYLEMGATIAQLVGG